MNGTERLKGTLEQLPVSAEAYYRDSLSPKNSPYTYEYTGRRDAVGARVYLRVFQGESDGFSALMSYQTFVARVKEAAKHSSSMGVPRFYRPVDPETGNYWGAHPPLTVES